MDLITQPPTGAAGSLNTWDNIDIIDIAHTKTSRSKMSDRPVILGSWSAFEIFRRYRDSCKTYIPEEVIALFLNQGNRVLQVSRLCQGTPRTTLNDFRMVLEEALRVGTCSIVIMHKHPRNLQAKTEQEFARKLKNVAERFDITLFDYLMIGECTYFPLVESNVI